MYGYVKKIVTTTAALLIMTVFNERLFAANDSAGCMGCHQSEIITTIDQPIDKSNDNPKTHQTNHNQIKSSTD